jgi:hypothetical protein
MRLKTLIPQYSAVKMTPSASLLPLDDCFCALQSSIPHLTRFSLLRLFQHTDISRLPEPDEKKREKKKFKQYLIGYFHINIAEVRTEEGKSFCSRRSHQQVCLHGTP